MRYVRAKVAEADETLSYRAYMTESVWLQAQNQRLRKSWLDIIDPKPEDNRTGDEIAMDYVRRMKNGAT